MHLVHAWLLLWWWASGDGDKTGLSSWPDNIGPELCDWTEVVVTQLRGGSFQHGPAKAKVSSTQCVCDRGYYFIATSNNCAECDKGSYKDAAGNDEACILCEAGNTTFDAGSVAASSCVPEVTSSQDGGLPGSAGGSANLQNSSEVPAVSFNMSLSNLPATTDLASIRSQLIVSWLTAVDIGGPTAEDPWQDF